MAEQWELWRCGSGVVNFYIPGIKNKTIQVKEYIKSMGGEIRFVTEEMDPVPYILSEGWEPFAVAAPYFYFRRKINS